MSDNPENPDTTAAPEEAEQEARFADFDADAAEQEGTPVEFTLGGVTFTCVHPVPTGQALAAIRRAMKKGGPEGMLDTLSTCDLLEGWVIEEQRGEMFEKALEHVLDWTETGDAMMEIISKSSARPTTGS